MIDATHAFVESGEGIESRVVSVPLRVCRRRVESGEGIESSIIGKLPVAVQ